MVRLGVPGCEPAGLAGPPRRCGVALAADGWADDALRRPRGARPWWSGPGLGRDAATVADVRRLVARSPVPVVVDADGLYALGRVGRRPARPGRARRWCSPPTTASTPG